MKIPCVKIEEENFSKACLSPILFIHREEARDFSSPETRPFRRRR
ncbi:hypothetical protein CSUI_006862 [Cystoisospora suis]|uniref:Uncharacterized protein n=1 Tax=Cystoisospora suis TaxID=483139 RepID=A0A2C6KSL4_9APIC|nr:hypothetical protein CSUI_006862 [Cystoisospora suis]